MTSFIMILVFLRESLKFVIPVFLAIHQVWKLEKWWIQALVRDQSVIYNFYSVNFLNRVYTIWQYYNTTDANYLLDENIKLVTMLS